MQLISVSFKFVLAYAEKRFSHDVADFNDNCRLLFVISPCKKKAIYSY